MDREAWLKLLPLKKRTEPPVMGSYVVYFREGEEEAGEYSYMFKAPMWSLEPPPPEGKLPQVLVCQVSYHRATPLARLWPPL
jgi:hypothetical protein